jgi:hypothetical protein
MQGDFDSAGKEGKEEDQLREKITDSFYKKGLKLKRFNGIFGVYQKISLTT